MSPRSTSSRRRVALAERRLLAEQLEVARSGPGSPGTSACRGAVPAPRVRRRTRAGPTPLRSSSLPSNSASSRPRGVSTSNLSANGSMPDLAEALQRLPARAQDLCLARQPLVRLELTHRRSRRSARRPGGAPPASATARGAGSCGNAGSRRARARRSRSTVAVPELGDDALDDRRRPRRRCRRSGRTGCTRPCSCRSPMRGAVSSTRVRRAVRENRLAADACMPGAITPPMNSPLSETTSKFVAVPKSTTIAGPPNRANAARAFTTRSAPTSRGLSVRIGTPVFVPGPTMTGGDGEVAGRHLPHRRGHVRDDGRDDQAGHLRLERRCPPARGTRRGAGRARPRSARAGWRCARCARARRRGRPPGRSRCCRRRRRGASRGILPSRREAEVVDQARRREPRRDQRAGRSVHLRRAVRTSPRRRRPRSRVERAASRPPRVPSPRPAPPDRVRRSGRAPPPRRARGTGIPPARAPRVRGRRCATRAQARRARGPWDTPRSVTGSPSSFDHPADEEELLRVLLAEVRGGRAHHVEQPMDGREHAGEVTGPRGALQHVADRARVRHRELDAGRIELVHRRRPHQVGARAVRPRATSRCLVPRVAGQVLAGTRTASGSRRSTRRPGRARPGRDGSATRDRRAAPPSSAPARRRRRPTGVRSTAAVRSAAARISSIARAPLRPPRAGPPAGGRTLDASVERDAAERDVSADDVRGRRRGAPRGCARSCRRRRAPPDR